jgi:hypothetical protein
MTNLGDKKQMKIKIYDAGEVYLMDIPDDELNEDRPFKRFWDNFFKKKSKINFEDSQESKSENQF